MGYCPGAEEVALLDSCEMGTPCPTLIIKGGQGAVDHDIETCVLEGLRDEVTGVYEILMLDGFSGGTTRLYVHGGVVDRVTLGTTDVVVCPERAAWLAAETCQLAPPAFFADCLEAPLPKPECSQQLENWVSDCFSPPQACLDGFVLPVARAHGSVPRSAWHFADRVVPLGRPLLVDDARLQDRCVLGAGLGLPFIAYRGLEAPGPGGSVVVVQEAAFAR